jgi:acyl-lipid omega-6 desaturase (Delta-12 desaturase)
LALNLNRYRDPDPRRSALELTLTAGAFALCWLLMWMTLEFGYWLTLLMAMPAAGFLVRLFMIQHDCGHGAFFRNRSTNNWVGRVIGALTLTPYDFWRRSHNIHHASSGNLDHRGIGDITTSLSASISRSHGGGGSNIGSIVIHSRRLRDVQLGSKATLSCLVRWVR